MQNTDRLCMGCMNDNGGETVCPICGFDESTPQISSYMPLRTWLDDRYLIGKVVESNGEGITYLAWDNEENMQVRVREYMPDRLCERAADRHSVKILDGCEYVFNDQLVAFLDLARALARLSNLPSLLPVTDIFEANGTAYYVTENISAISLREFLLRNGGSLSWEQSRPILMPVLTTLAALHEEGIIHRGISPDTLMIGRDGKIRMVGFCVAGARTARTELSAQLFPGFAAIEQYGFENQQGSWTDVYGFTATLYRVLVGNPPPEATERVTNDRMIIPAKVAQTLPKHVMTAMADGLAILADDRTQDMEQLKADLVPHGSQGRAAVKSPAPSKGTKPANSGKGKKGGKKSTGNKYALLAAIMTVIIIIVGVVIFYQLVLKDKFDNGSNPASDAPPPSSTAVSLIPDPESKEKLIAIPSFVNLTYAEIMKNPEYKQNFTFEIVEKTYNDNYGRGKIYEQSPAKDTIVKPGQKITIKVSMGPSRVVLPSYANWDFDAVYIDLLKKGFLPDNIRKEDKWDDKVLPGKVVGTDPAAGNAIMPDSEIIVYINSYNPIGSSDLTSQIQ